MTKPSSFTIVRSAEDYGYDYLIGGTPLKRRLQKHEPGKLDHQSSLGVADGARDRLLLRSDPDLYGGAVALYLCGMCGGYDGNPIGAHIRRERDTVVWDALGFHFDTGDEPALFKKITSFTFEWKQYEESLLGVLET